MRIISENHDFYDSAQAHGADRALIYARRRQVTPGACDGFGIDLTNLPRLEQVDRPGSERPDYADRYAVHVLLFCGQYRPVVERRQSPHGYGRDTVSHLWSLEALDAAIAQASEAVRKAYARRGDRNHRFGRSAVGAVFGLRPDPATLAAVHSRHASPVLLYRNVYRDLSCPDVETERDPSLKDLGFQTQSDPFATFQEIAMYIGGVMRAPERATIALTDEERRDKHGMDRWSFRTKVR